MIKIIFAIFLSFWLGAIVATFTLVDNNKTIEYIKGDAITDTILIPVPYDVEVPADPKLIMKHDTIIVRDTVNDTVTVTVVESVDTLAIIADYVKLRRYQHCVFDSATVGQLVVSADVQFNRLEKLGYSFIPYVRTNPVVRRIHSGPYITATTSGINKFGIGAGFKFGSVGAGATFMNDKTLSLTASYFLF